MYEAIQPIVLVGGKSTRFGRDKLREPVPGGTPGEVLVNRPIRALREVFGPRVASVGECHSTVASKADDVINDRYPGAGPIGGILSALEETGREVFVLGGDLPRITGAVVKQILTEARGATDAWAILGRTARGVEPCIGLYRPAARAALKSRMSAGGGSRLQDAIPEEHLVTVAIDAASAANVNVPGDLQAGGAGAGGAKPRKSWVFGGR